ncbi:MAG: replicative DNA helicase [Candidatus Margulisbacteria bacterium]|nr:replicative DNA helicase [Candidatus Margulisiibacteriota bacterium]
MTEVLALHDHDSERSVLGAMMMSPTAIDAVADRLKEFHFSVEAHQTIFCGILELHHHNTPVDIITLSNLMNKHDLLVGVGGKSYLADILDSVPSASNVEHYANIVIDKGIRRRIGELGANISKNINNESIEIEEVLENVQKSILDASSQKLRKRVKSLDTILAEVREKVISPDSDKGIGTGFRDLSKFISGFKPSDLVILAARPSVGKTAFALNFAMNAAKKNVPVLFFSLEMSSEQLGSRMLSYDTRIDSQKFQNNDISEKDLNDIDKSIGKLSKLPLHIEETGSLTMTEMRAITRQMVAKNGIKMIIIDYLQLMRSAQRKVESRFQEVSEIVRDLKAFAKEMNISIIALSQLSRSLEQRSDKRPQLSDLRETGEIEQTSDIVMFLHRDDYFETAEIQSPIKNYSEVEVIISKHRNGPTGKVNLIYRRDVSCFVDAEMTKVLN